MKYMYVSTQNWMKPVSADVEKEGNTVIETERKKVSAKNFVTPRSFVSNTWR